MKGQRNMKRSQGVWNSNWAMFAAGALTLFVTASSDSARWQSSSYLVQGPTYSVARLVWLEALKGPDKRGTPLDEIKHEPVAADTGEVVKKEESLNCLDDCLDVLPGESRDLIMEYYIDEKRGRIDRRRELAERLGLRRDALANRAQRLRDKLEQCVTRCLKKKLRYEARIFSTMK